MFLFFIVIFAGILSVLAPCVLPVLPIILAGSIAESGRKAPLIIIGSLVISIIVFTGLLKASTVFIMVSPDFWTYLSAGLVTFLWFAYLFPDAWSQVSVSLGIERSGVLLSKTQRVHNPSLRLILTGIALGPVFSSCSPTYSLLLASIFPASFTLGILYTAVYSISFGAMLFLVAIGGQKLIRRLHFLSEGRGIFRKALGVIFILTGIAIATGFSTSIENSLIARFNVNNFEQIFLDRYLQSTHPNLPQAMPNVFFSSGSLWPSLALTTGISAPEIPANDSTWVNSPPLTMHDLLGKVVLIDFWTYSCINCQRTIPYIVAWDKKYRDKGLVIIGVHAPEFSFEQVPENVRKAIQADGIEYPVVLDNTFSLWNAYHNAYWPAKYFIDKTGKIRHYHFGEGAYDESEEVIQYLLSEGTGETMATGMVNVATDMTVRADQSPETYLGMRRRDGLRDGIDPSTLAPSMWTLAGGWSNDVESITSTDGAQLSYRYSARDVYLVLAGSGTVTALVDGKKASDLGILGESADPSGRITVWENRLYHIIHAKSFQKEVLLQLQFSGTIHAFAFTFGS